MDIQQRARRIKLLISDVDGVLSNGRIYVTSAGNHFQSFHVHDGLGLTLLKKVGIEVAIISASNSPIIKDRMAFLGITHVYQGYYNKLAAYEALLTKLQFKDEEVAYIGDDLPDLPIIERVGLGVAVPNATPIVKARACMQTKNPGGFGAVREICDLIIETQGYFNQVMDILKGHERSN